MKDKKLVFSVTREDCDWQTFSSGGPGGQHQNKTQSGVRCIHTASGAVGESREDRSQWVNKQRAFKRMGKSDKFQQWVKMEIARRAGKQVVSVEDRIEAAMEPENVVVEYFDGVDWIKQ